MVQCQEQGPIVQLRQPGIDPAQALDLDVVRQIVGDRTDQWSRKVLIQR
jgi:hypothetical protein